MKGVIIMLKATDVAMYFLSKDPDRILFNKNIATYNGRKFYEGNARLNKYLFLAQVVYLAKYEKKLFDDNFIAYDNGPIIDEVRTNYAKLIHANYCAEISENDKKFLDKIYYSLKDASCEELIEISHEDPEWKRLSNQTFNAPIMNIESNIDEYKSRYAGLIKALKI